MNCLCPPYAKLIIERKYKLGLRLRSHEQRIIQWFGHRVTWPQLHTFLYTYNIAHFVILACILRIACWSLYHHFFYLVTWPGVRSIAQWVARLNAHLRWSLADRLSCLLSPLLKRSFFGHRPVWVTGLLHPVSRAVKHCFTTIICMLITKWIRGVISPFPCVRIILLEHFCLHHRLYMYVYLIPTNILRSLWRQRIFLHRQLPLSFWAIFVLSFSYLLFTKSLSFYLNCILTRLLSYAMN